MNNISSRGIFGSISNLVKSNPETDPYWTIPEDTEQIDEILNTSRRPQVIYKHSYRCSISLFSKSSLDSAIDELKQHADLYLIDVVSMKSLSDYVAQNTRVRHQSPQLILLHNGKPFWQTSHGEVRSKNLQEALNKLTEAG